VGYEEREELIKKYEFEDEVEICQIKINDSEYENKIARLIECLLEIDETQTQADANCDRKAA